jgi:hypothetical protein
VRAKTYEVTVGRPEDEDVVLETFPVTTEEGFVILHA